MVLNLYVAIDFLMLLNGWIRGAHFHALFYFMVLEIYGAGDSIYQSVHSAQAQCKLSYTLSLLIFYYKALQDDEALQDSHIGGMGQLEAGWLTPALLYASPKKSSDTFIDRQNRSFGPNLTGVQETNGQEIKSEHM